MNKKIETLTTTDDSPPDYPTVWNPAASEPLKIDPLSHTGQAAFERTALKTRRLTETELSKPFTDQL